MFRYAKTLTWQTFTVFYDDSVSESLADSIHEVLSRNTAVPMLKVRGSGDIRNLLSDIPVRKSGNRFMVFTRKNMVEEFISTVSSGNVGNLSTVIFIARQNHRTYLPSKMPGCML